MARTIWGLGAAASLNSADRVPLDQGATAGSTKRSTLAELGAWVIESLAGFVQAGTGAVARSVRDKLRERISVTDFGAVLDGVTDDSAAVLAAVARAEAMNGARVHIPAGVCATSVPFTSAVDGVSLEGGA